MRLACASSVVGVEEAACSLLSKLLVSFLSGLGGNLDLAFFVPLYITALLKKRTLRFFSVIQVIKAQIKL